MKKINRRDFLKISSGFLAGGLLSGAVNALGRGANKLPNIIIILCDSLSARNMSLYGYPRKTTPNVDAFANKSTVYHANYSASNFTTTGTASLLTGMDAWKHRALSVGGLVLPEYASTNFNSLLGLNYNRLAFCQNTWADRLTAQHEQDVDIFLSPASYSLHKDNLPASWIAHDRVVASIAADDLLFSEQGGAMSSSVIGPYYRHVSQKSLYAAEENLARYPQGIPQLLVHGSVTPYLNEDIFQGVYGEIARLASAPLPYFAYFHLYSPHIPYKPRLDFLKLFRDDGYVQPMKPQHLLSPHLKENYVASRRTLYDAQAAQVDHEFGKLINKLDKLGILDNSYVIFTSDHGELFERGFSGHGFHFMYEGVLRTPLLIRAPAQTTRADVFSPTSITDLLPTLLHFAGKEIPSDIDGEILPGFGGAEKPERPIFALHGADNSAFAPLTKFAAAMRKGDYKLIAYFGIKDFNQVFELYNLKADPEELTDLSQKEPSIFAKMKHEFDFYLDKADKSFISK